MEFHVKDDDNEASSAGYVSFNQRTRFWLCVFVIVFFVIILRQCHTLTASKTKESTPIFVMTAPAYRTDIPIYLNALGSVIPNYSVIVKAQVNGQLIKILFTEGQMIKKGDLLAEIDAKPYLAQLMQYEGQLARDRAQLINAKIDLKRYQTLWKQDSVSQQIVATQAALVEQLEGTIKLDEGLIAATKVNLAYCKITSPIDGRIGLRAVDPGNIVQTTDTNGIAVVNMTNPIAVIFSIPEDNIPAVLQEIAKGNQLTVTVFDREQKLTLAKGTLLTMDNQVDQTTGTVKLKAQLNNDRFALFPNQFVNIRLLIKILHDTVVIPTAAIQHNPTGTFVYIVNNNSTVSVRPVVTNATIQDKTSVYSGVSVGESVVIAGADKLTHGAKVKLAPNAITPSVMKRKT